MWATITLSCRLWPPTTTTGNQSPFTVSAKYSRHRKNINYDYDEDDELDNQQELDILRRQKIGESEASAPKEKISGSVVLLALQKASAEKISKKIKKKKNKVKNVKDEEVRRRGDASADYSDVKPLCIKSDWKDRLDELETQLHQLIHNA